MMLLLGALLLASLLALIFSWVVSLFVNQRIRIFIRWLPIVLLWTPVKLGVEYQIFPAGIAVFLLQPDSHDLFMVFKSEAIAVLLFVASCLILDRKRGRRLDSNAPVNSD